MMSASIVSAPGVDERTPRHEGVARAAALRTVLSFDVEEHHRIEAAAALFIDAGLKAHYRLRFRSVIFVDTGRRPVTTPREP